MKESKVKSTIKNSRNKRAFTIVELLTIMSIIVILMGLLLPALNKVKRYAKEVKQKAQFHSIDVALELFNTEHDGYPKSDALGGDDLTPYCGAMRLAEAMMGQDLLGFHPDSIFSWDGVDSAGNQLYADLANTYNPDADNLSSRKGPYLQLENANAYRVMNLYTITDPFSEEAFVLCDVYSTVTHKETGKSVGMPILYYRANTSGSKNPNETADNDVLIGDEDNIYNYKDNDQLVLLGHPRSLTAVHPIASAGTYGDPPITADPKKFYEDINNDRILLNDGRPYRSDSYILLSAGFDGKYGTSDDIFNF